MAVEYELTLHDYIEIVKRRALLMVAAFISVFAIAAAIAVVLPPVYQSSGTILIESQQIASNIIASSVTGYASERIEVIKQRVMTRENLSRIIDKYNLYNAKDKGGITSDLIDSLRNSINIDFLSTNIGGRRGQKATIAFSISFEDRNNAIAYRVTNELVTLFLDENVKSRVERASETTDFLTQEADRLKTELEKMEALVAKYKQENSEALPEHLDLRMSMLQRSETQLAELNREYKATQNELRRLDLELTAAKSGRVINGQPVSELEKLRQEYNKAKVLYKENHPTIRVLKRKIADLEKIEKESGNTSDASSVSVDNILVAKLNSLIATAKSRLTTIGEQRKPLASKIEKLQEQIIKTPQVELGLSKLLRDHGNAKQKYEEILSKQLSAQIAENLEGENKSERFTLIDPPLLPDRPIKPNRAKIILLGLMLAFGIAGGIAFLLEMLNQRLRGKGAIAAFTGESPLVEIPYIVTSDEHEKRKKLILRLVIIIVVAVIFLVISLHLFYKPIDLILYKIIGRFA